MTHTLTRQSTVDDVHGDELPASHNSWQSNEDYNLWHVTASSLVERSRCSRDTFCHHLGRRWKHQACTERYLPARIHGVTFHKIMVLMHLSSQLQSQWAPTRPRAKTTATSCLHHLEWHFDGAACKNKYIIFSFQWQLLIGWASKPQKFTEDGGKYFPPKHKK